MNSEKWIRQIRDAEVKIQTLEASEARAKMAVTGAKKRVEDVKCATEQICDHCWFLLPALTFSDQSVAGLEHCALCTVRPVVV